ncbi:uncharacterized protein BYT42DRAFT_257233 [Radiomyces spectabilis]|uniref:uncharacterized protein n=1 Tax=Radiomyces spectabilis TaxID=64574 RepID=UPI00221F7CBD|nr:uncharacterized protein BYT42DRAFT_257233 [Radiomyces spectabilis]KAI8384329.1 hypothetical protein BYT42DRAFT_257233 [Radiomyces spectabilis]
MPLLLSAVPCSFQVVSDRLRYSRGSNYERIQSLSALILQKENHFVVPTRSVAQRQLVTRCNNPQANYFIQYPLTTNVRMAVKEMPAIFWADILICNECCTNCPIDRTFFAMSQLLLLQYHIKYNSTVVLHVVLVVLYEKDFNIYRPSGAAGFKSVCELGDSVHGKTWETDGFD